MEISVSGGEGAAVSFLGPYRRNTSYARLVILLCCASNSEIEPKSLGSFY